MKFNGKEITANIMINTNTQLNQDFLNKYFLNEEIETCKSEEIDINPTYEFNFFISKSSISDEKIKELVKELAEYENYEIIIDSDDINFYDNYIYDNKNNFITYKYVSEDFCGKSNQELLLGILFHTKEEKIELV